jgi:acyl-coenzyme A synthetase/AMP-(fatty) acid ligase
LTTHTPHFISLPELLSDKLNRPFCITTEGRNISRADLLTDALALSKYLPDKAYAINICQQRYFFIVSYLAVILKGQTTLLPPNQTQGTINNLLSDYSHSYCLSDFSDENRDSDFIVDWDLLVGETKEFPLIDCHRIISISFTSGSTGEPKTIKKNWQEFQCSAELALQRFELTDKTLTLVATVPMQHMYGLETCLFWLLFSNLKLHNTRPFYPEDIRATLKSVDAGLLISTPTHLKSCLNSQGSWTNTKFILSSTAPMPTELAGNIENFFNAPLFEVYGSTETLSFASRRLVLSKQWLPYDGVRLYQQQHRFFAQGGHLIEAIALDDCFIIESTGSFKSLGRSSDMIKIAGKRASLTELNHLLIQLTIVDDGIFFKKENQRLAAFVVSMASKKDIMTKLKHSVDAVFLPRNLYYVTKLPRNETGKIIQTELAQLIQGLKRG